MQPLDRALIHTYEVPSLIHCTKGTVCGEIWILRPNYDTVYMPLLCRALQTKD